MAGNDKEKCYAWWPPCDSVSTEAFVSSLQRKAQMKHWNKKAELANPIGFWLCLAPATGAGLGAALGNLVVGVVLGIVAGVAIGILQQKKQKNTDTDK